MWVDEDGGRGGKRFFTKNTKKAQEKPHDSVKITLLRPIENGKNQQETYRKRRVNFGTFETLLAAITID